MNEELAQLYYDSDVVRIKSSELHIDFCQLFSHTRNLFRLTSYAARVLEDYAIDSLLCPEDTLPFAPGCADQLELPFQWLKNGKMVGNLQGVRRTMYLASVTPSEADLKTLCEFFENTDIELVGVFSFLGFPRTDPPTRLINLISWKEVLNIYKSLHIISEEEYKHLLLLSQNEKS